MSRVESFTLNSAEHTIEGTGLHDATLKSVTMNWKEAEIVAELELLGGVSAKLTFHEVANAVLPREHPWGPSSSINDARTLSEGMYEIEMQSGDTLRIAASCWSMRIRPAQGAA